MAELVRRIEETDIPKLHEIMSKVFGDYEWKDIQRLGGMTNRSYKITRNNNQEYLVRIPGEGTENMINRKNEQISTELSRGLGIDSALIYFDDSGYKVMKFIQNPQQMNDEVIKRKDIIIQVANIFRKLHTCGVDTGVKFETFEIALLYEKIISDAKVTLYKDYREIKDKVMRIKAEIDKNNEIIKVPCHNDCLVDNWVLDNNDRLYLVDWEYSGMNDAMWDLSCLSIEASYSETDDEELLEAYFGRKVSVKEKKNFIANKLYVDYLWTLRGLTRVPFDGQFMQEYANERYSRLKKNIEKYNDIK